MSDSNDPLAPLRDSGQRYWRRFVPPPDLPARVAIVANGGRIGEREVIDMSMGGLGLRLRWRDHTRIEIGVTMHIELSLLGGVPLQVQAKCMHMQRTKDGLFHHWVAGLMFDTNLAYTKAKPTMARYLLKIDKAERKAAAAK
jgi:hypothetical protein